MSMASGSPSSNWRLYMRGLLLIATLVAVAYFLEAIAELLNKNWIDNQVRGKGIDGELLFVAAGAVITAVGLPRQMICFLGGYAFGFLTGSLLALVATVLGCMLAFFYARWLGRKLLKSRYPDRIQKIDHFIRDNPFTMTLLIRLLPVGSNVFTNLAAGVSSVRTTPFFSGSAIGYIPQSVVFALIGSGIHLNPGWRIGLGVILFVISSVLGVYLYRSYRKGKSVDEILDRG